MIQIKFKINQLLIFSVNANIFAKKLTDLLEENPKLCTKVWQKISLSLIVNISYKSGDFLKAAKYLENILKILNTNIDAIGYHFQLVRVYKQLNEMV